MHHWDSRILEYWAGFLQVDSAVFSQTGLTARFVQNTENQVIVYTIGTMQIVDVPNRFEQTVQGVPRNRDSLAEWLQASLTLQWRDFYYYASALFTSPFLREHVHVLTKNHAAGLAHLQAQCEAAETELAEISINDPLVVGYFDGERLIGAASLLHNIPDIFDIGVITHPAYRGRQVGSALTAYLRNHVTSERNIALYITMESNRGSVRVAEKCGFDLFLIEEGYTMVENAAPA